MRDYGKVSPQFWTGETGKALKSEGTEAVVVALYLMTSPHANMIGLYYLPKMYIAHETGLGMEAAARGLAGAIKAGFCAYDEDAEMVFVPRMAAYQIAETLSVKDNRRIAVVREVSACPHSEFAELFRQAYAAPFNMEAPCYPSVPHHRFSPSLVARVVKACGGVCKGCGAPFGEDLRPTIDHIVAKINGGGREESNLQALCGPCNSRKAVKDRALFWETVGIEVTPYEGVRKGSNDSSAPLRSQEQEQEQEREQEQKRARESAYADLSPATALPPPEDADDSDGEQPRPPQGEQGRPPCPHERIIALYHEVLPELRQIREWNETRRRLLQRRWSENPERQNLDWWRQFFGYVRESRFLMGQTTGRDGRPFDCDLEWLIRPTNFAKVVEGKYEDQAA
jgi:hypothetical protein